MRAKAIFSVKISETGFNELNICSKGPEKHKRSEKKSGYMIIDLPCRQKYSLESRENVEKCKQRRRLKGQQKWKD